LLGVPRADLIGQALSNFVAPADQAAYYGWRKQVVQGDRPSPCELRMLTSNGAGFWAMLDASETHLQDDEPVVQTVLNDVSARKSAELALQEAQQRLNNFALRQQQDFEALRIEVAHEVHDQLGQILAAIKLETDLLRELAPLAAARMHALVQTGVASVRDISRALRPAALELGLVHALRVMVEEMSSRAGIPIESFLPERLPPLSGKVERGLCHIAQEALTNAMLHSRTSRIQISLEASADGLVLDIHDDGCGFKINSPSASRGLGLLGMRERARQLGAQLALQSRPGHGTRIHLTWPLTSC
jgi:PAS domain S-box-containing protein